MSYDRTYKQTDKNILLLHTELSWGPSVTQLTLRPFTRFRKLLIQLFILRKVDSLNLQSQAKLRTSQWIFQVPQSKFEANRSRGCRVMIGPTNKQAERHPNRDYNFKC